MNKMPAFRQTAVRAWTWMILIVMSVLSALFALWYGMMSSVILHTFIACLVFWVDQLEKEVTRRNIGEK